MASANFTNLAKHIANGTIKFDGSVSYKVLLVSAAPSSTDLDSWEFRSSVTTEVTGTAYTAGGIAQAFTLGSLDTANNRIGITWTNITDGWSSATLTSTTVGAIIYQNTGAAGTDRLVQYVEFDAPKTVSSANFSITYNNPLYITVG